MRVEAAALALRTIDDFDWALVRWCCGVQDAETRRAAWARVMLLAVELKQVDEARGGPRWPKGRLSAFTHVALEELRPAVVLTHAARLTLIADQEQGRRMARSGVWARTWWARYQTLLETARGLEDSVRSRLEVAARGVVNTGA
jgi:hypothetical protein